jgi:hypothetical protein
MAALEITIDEGRDMDFVLNKIANLQETHHSNVIEINYIYHKFLKEKGEYYVTDLIYKILNHEPKVLITDKKSGIKTNVWSTPLLSNFLSTGGFTKISNEQAIIAQNKRELEKLNLEKARFDLKNARRIYKTYWWTFSFSIIALIISFFLLYLKIREGKGNSVGNIKTTVAPKSLKK